MKTKVRHEEELRLHVSYPLHPSPALPAQRMAGYGSTVTYRDRRSTVVLNTWVRLGGLSKRYPGIMQFVRLSIDSAGAG